MRKIATKVSRKLKKAQASKVIDLGQYRQQKKEFDKLFNEVKTVEQAVELGHDPLHADQWRGA